MCRASVLCRMSSDPLPNLLPHLFTNFVHFFTKLAFSCSADFEEHENEQGKQGINRVVASPSSELPIPHARVKPNKQNGMPINKWDLPNQCLQNPFPEIPFSEHQNFPPSFRCKYIQIVITATAPKITPADHELREKPISLTPLAANMLPAIVR